MGQQRILVGDTVQTRRNDQLMGVENRAQWIVRGIRNEYLSLVSVTDSREVARVSTEYAREHLQLAYASTVHGVQATPPTRRWSAGRRCRGTLRRLTRADAQRRGRRGADGCLGPRVPRRLDAARHSRVDDAGCCERGPGGGAACGKAPGGGDGYGTGGWGTECGARAWDVEVCDYRALNEKALGPLMRPQLARTDHVQRVSSQEGPSSIAAKPRQSVEEMTLVGESREGASAGKDRHRESGDDKRQ